MDNGQFDLLMNLMLDVRDRLARLEERHKILSVFWGALGGLLALLPTLGIWYLSR